MTNLPHGVARVARWVAAGALVAAAGQLVACRSGILASRSDAGTDTRLGFVDGASAPPCVPGSPEVCDGYDNNCNGTIDEGVHNACGNCGEFCLPAAEVGTLDEGAVRVTADDGANPSHRAGVTLAQSATFRRFLWAANHEHDSVTKFDMVTEEEDGVYWAGLNPSRTAVDLDGNAWIGGRGDGRLTKVLWDKTTCPDRNGNGRVDTSSVQGGKSVLVNSASDPLADECVAFSQVTRSDRPNIRGLAVAPDGMVWIGYSDGGIQPIHPTTFNRGPLYEGRNVPLWTADGAGVLRVSGTADTGGAYGLVVDSKGLLYVAPVGEQERADLPCFDTVGRSWLAIYRRAARCSYGIAVDSKDRIWTGSHIDCTGVGLFDPAQRRFHTFAVPNEASVSPGATSAVTLIANGGAGGLAGYDSTGVAVEPKTGHVWTSFYQQGYTGRLELDESDLAQSRWRFIGTARTATGELLPGVTTDLRGVGFDVAGYAWTLGLGSDRVFKLDPATNQRAASMPEGKAIGVGTHYTYSDFTGSSVFNFTAPGGGWRHVFDARASCAKLRSLHWEAYVPPGTSVTVRLRVAAVGATAPGEWLPDQAADGKSSFGYPTDAGAADLDLAPYAARLEGGPTEVEVRFATSDRKVRPVLHVLQIVVDRGSCVY
jgi:hypothetical protein